LIIEIDQKLISPAQSSTNWRRCMVLQT